MPDCFGLRLSKRPPTQATPTVGGPAFAAKLQPLLLAKMKEQQTPGAIVFVDDPGQGSWTIALGTSNLATHAPMNVNSHMRIGSITKTMTATVILQLVDQGKLRLDDPVSTYQPEVPNGAHITIRELLNMTSGIFDYLEDTEFFHTMFTNPTKVWDLKDLLAIAFKHQPYFAPGRGWHYSSTNYILLGMIIEQLSHQRVEQVFQQRIFTPLGMVGSSLQPITSAAIPDPHPQGYLRLSRTGPVRDATDLNQSWGWAAGSAISTLHDLQIWAKALATGQLLSAATHKEQLSWTPTSNDTYGLGVMKVDPGSGFIGHGGLLAGFQSEMAYQPQKGATIVVLTNLNAAPDGSLPAEQLMGIILKELFA